jgi:hypothetical protein
VTSSLLIHMASQLLEGPVFSCKTFLRLTLHIYSLARSPVRDVIHSEHDHCSGKRLAVCRGCQSACVWPRAIAIVSQARAATVSMFTVYEVTHGLRALKSTCAIARQTQNFSQGKKLEIFTSTPTKTFLNKPNFSRCCLPTR